MAIEHPTSQNAGEPVRPSAEDEDAVLIETAPGDWRPKHRCSAQDLEAAGAMATARDAVSRAFGQDPHEVSEAVEATLQLYWSEPDRPVCRFIARIAESLDE